MQDFSEEISPRRNKLPQPEDLTWGQYSDHPVDPDECRCCWKGFVPGQTRFVVFDATPNGWCLSSWCMDCLKACDPRSAADHGITPNLSRRNCQGCGEPIAIPHSKRFHWEVCSRRCYLRVYRKQRRLHGSTIAWKMRPETWPECEVCKRPMEGKRSDTRFCSNACRQWAYRRRRSG